MEYNEFKDTITDTIACSLGDGFTVSPMEINKVNGTRDAIVISSPGSIISPTIYIDDLYEIYLIGCSVEEAAAESVDKIRTALAERPEIPDITAEAIRDHAYCAVINAERSSKLLKDVPHEMMADLAVVARYRTGDGASFIISDDVCRHVRLTGSEVMEMAHSNTNKREDIVFMSLSDMMREKMGLDAGITNGNTRLDEPELYVLTNKQCHDGAAAITNKAVLNEAFDRLGSYTILPSSRHEVLLCPDSLGIDAKALEKLVREVNAAEVSDQDYLSDHVYAYDGRRIALAEPEIKAKEYEHLLEHVRSH